MGSRRSLHVSVEAEVLDHLRAGTSVDLRGLHGSGRSTVLRVVAGVLADEDWSVLHVQGIAALKDRPLEALAVAGVAVRGDKRAASAVAAAVGALEEIAQPGRSLVLIDNVDDLDPVSAGVVTAAHARTAVPVLTASRPLPATLSEPHRLPVEIRPGVELHVPALGYVDVQTLLADLLPGPIDTAVVSRIYAASGGLPALAVAIAQNARRRGLLRRVDGTWSPAPDMWSPELSRTIAPLVQELSPGALEGLESLSVAGAVDLAVARELVSWESLEELDACGLLRFVRRGDSVVVGAFPQMVAEHFRHLGTNARQLRLGERVAAATGGPRTSAAGAPALVGSTPTAPVPNGPVGFHTSRAREETDSLWHRMLVEHWYREIVLRRDEWEAAPTPTTAVPYLRALLVGDSDAESARAVVEQTPRIDRPRAIAVFDNWHALYVAFVERDLGGALTVLGRARAEIPDWAPLLRGVEEHLTMLLDHIPSDDRLDVFRLSDLRPEAAWTIAITRAERHVLRAEPALARPLLGRSHTTSGDLARTEEVVEGLALLLDARIDDALDHATQQLARARTQLDVDAVHGHAFVMSLGLLLRLRTHELREHLGSVLSTGLMSALQRPYEAGNLAVAAAVALLEGRPTTARTLAHQSAALGLGLSPLPGGMPTWTFARLDAGDHGPVGGTERAASDALWDESRELLRRGYRAAGVTSGCLALDLAPDAGRAEELLTELADLPAGLARHLERFVVALHTVDPEIAVREGSALLDDGQVLLGVRALAGCVRMLRAHGDVPGAVAALDRARRLVAPFGPDATAMLAQHAHSEELTDREREIVLLVARGQTNQDVADQLHLSVRTVENHLHRTFRKLGVESRAELGPLFPS